jgi:hypothetical protein
MERPEIILILKQVAAVVTVVTVVTVPRRVRKRES